MKIKKQERDIPEEFIRNYNENKFLNLTMAIDPGSTNSGVVLISHTSGFKPKIVFACHSFDNEELLKSLSVCDYEDEIVIEKPVIYSASKTVGDTLFFTGRLFQQFILLGIKNLFTYNRSGIRGFFINKHTRVEFPGINVLNNADAQIKFIISEEVLNKYIEIDPSVKLSKDSWQALAAFVYHFFKNHNVNLYKTF